MRLIAGEAKGRRLQVPRGLRVRPSGARLRESAFGILEHRDAIAGARVLDLFAGTGALGLEALSRGASSLLAVEQDRAVAKTLLSNATSCGFADRVEVRVQPVETALQKLSGRDRFDLVLLDPPYRMGLVEGVLDRLHDGDLLAPGAWVLVEHAHDEQVSEGDAYLRDTCRRQGDAGLTLLRRAASEEASSGATH